jgi:hypothetical protein
LAATAAICPGLAAKGATEDPEGPFTSVWPLATVLRLLQVAHLSWLERSVGKEKSPAGPERVSTTTLGWQAMWRMVGENLGSE